MSPTMSSYISLLLFAATVLADCECGYTVRQIDGWKVSPRQHQALCSALRTSTAYLKL